MTPRLDYAIDGTDGVHVKQSDARDDITALRAQIQEQKDYYAKVINEPCPRDEIHCACVPALRARIAELEAALKEIAIYVPGVDGNPGIRTWFEEYELLKSYARCALEKKP